MKSNKAQDGPKLIQVGTHGDPRWSKIGRRMAWNGAKSVEKMAQLPKDGPKAALDSPQTGEDGPQTAQDGARIAPRDRFFQYAPARASISSDRFAALTSDIHFS